MAAAQNLAVEMPYRVFVGAREDTTSYICEDRIYQRDKLLDANTLYVRCKYSGTVEKCKVRGICNPTTETFKITRYVVMLMFTLS